MKAFFFFILGIIFVFAVAIFVAWTGWVSVATSNSLGPVDTFLGFASDHSVAHHATDEKDPYLGQAAAIKEGEGHYREMCAVCHGAPGLAESEIAKGLKPEPPELWKEDSQSMTDGQMFWIVSNGIQMTGMPGFGKTHGKKKIWEIVAFLRHLPKLTAAEKADLEKGTGEEEEHESGEGMEKEGMENEGTGPREKLTAMDQLKTLEEALNLYYMDNSRYPATLEDLTKPTKDYPHGYLSTIPKDPWNEDYVYDSKKASAGEQFTLLSKGPDRKLHTGDDISVKSGK